MATTRALNAAELQAITVGFRGEYNKGFEMVNSLYQDIATVIPSSASSNVYPFLGDMYGVREWIGDREMRKLSQFKYALENKKFEMTVEVNRDDLDDDMYAVYGPMFQNFGKETAQFADRKVFDALKAGFTELCFDGQYFFDTDHPGYDENGAEISVSNVQSGAGDAWFLLDTAQPLKPIIYQLRRDFELVRMDKADDERVFMTGTIRYGTDGRMNTGYGFWQQAFASTDTLDATNFDAAYAAMMGLKTRSGEPIGITPSTLYVGASNRAAAQRIVEMQLINGGENNPNYGAVKLVVVPWLS